jgi:Domain of unknown function (DUF5666)
VNDRIDDTNEFERTPAPVAPTRVQSGTGSLRTGLAVAAALVLVVGAVAVSGWSLGRTDQAQLAAGASPSPAAANGANDEDGDGNGNGKGNDKGGPFGNHGNGPKFGGGGAFGGIVIASVNGNRIGLRTEDGWTRTITVAADTTIFRGSQAAKVGDLKVGDVVRLRQRRNDDGTFTILTIVVSVPRAAGEVTAIDGNTLTVKGRGGATLKITVSAATTYRLGPNAGSKSDVTVGSRIAAEGSQGASSFAATSIQIALPELGGEVTATTASSITVKRGDGTTATIHVSSTTIFDVRGKGPAATLADIAVGDRIEATGKLRADGSMDAAAVDVGKGKGPKAPKVEASPGG